MMYYSQCYKARFLLNIFRGFVKLLQTEFLNVPLVFVSSHVQIIYVIIIYFYYFRKLSMTINLATLECNVLDGMVYLIMYIMFQ